MSFSSYFLNIYTQIGLAALVATFGFTWWKGGPAERAGALILGLSAIGGDIGRAISGELAPTITMVVSDTLLSAGFLYIAVRYSSLWLGAAMIFQGCAFTSHAIQLNSTDSPRWHGMVIYLLAHNILSYLVMLSLIGGTLATMRKRRAAEQEKARLAAKAARPTERFTHPPQPLANNF